MKIRYRAAFALMSTLLLVVGLSATAEGQIVELDLDVVESPAFDGIEIPGIGQYEKLRGMARGVLDPNAPGNGIIVNLDRAPRNADGLVEYRTIVQLYRPVDATAWSGTVYHNVPNRGRAVSPDQPLLERGVAFLEVGWQGDIEPTDRNVVAILPVARQGNGAPITGRAVEEFIFGDLAEASNGRLNYPAATLDPARATLTVRRRQDAARQELNDWRFLDESTIRIARPAGYDGGSIYEFVYEAKDPTVMGIGFAALRDVVAFLRHNAADKAGNPSPLPGPAQHAVSIGISQSGRFLRDFLYLGFNQDLNGEIVFDGLHPDIAGSRKTFTNYPFSQPGRWQKQHEDHLYPGDQFPFTYPVLTDHLTGRTDGILARCQESGTCPKIVHTDGEAELWQARASLVVTDTRGEDIELPENVRAYLIAGTEHGGGPGVHAGRLSYGICQNLTNPMPLAPIRRALTVALVDWVVEGKTPPPSRFPSRGEGSLVPAAAVDFPDIPGVEYSGSVNEVRPHDFSVYPPKEGRPYPVFVGQVDDDGNMVGGVHHPNLSTPIGTYTGWNLRHEGFAEGAQCAGSGSFIPFAGTEEERRAVGDPRLSIDERYDSLGGYVTRVAGDARRLARARYLLPADAEEVINEALLSGVASGRR